MFWNHFKRLILKRNKNKQSTSQPSQVQLTGSTGTSYTTCTTESYLSKGTTILLRQFKYEGKSLCCISLDLKKQGNMFQLSESQEFLNLNKVQVCRSSLFKILKQLKFHSYKIKLV